MRDDVRAAWAADIKQFARRRRVFLDTVVVEARQRDPVTDDAVFTLSGVRRGGKPFTGSVRYKPVTGFFDLKIGG